MPTETPEKRFALAHYKLRGKYFREALSEELALDMVLIPAGQFWMGSQPEEPGAMDREQPQHEVKVPQFFIGRYPITQAQWRVVEGYPQIKQKLDPAPSRFKGDNRPVERVSWNDAVEFCQRLSRHTGRAYRLPSEAEWEYACRAGTTTPFHFGPTLSDDLANYDATAVFGSGFEGEQRGETTEVGQFPPNRFGLHDMHGNVWEWCEDDYHESYEGAPTDGTAWVEEDRSETDRVLRGGSWVDVPWLCRSAVRFNDSRDLIFFTVGFRVVCDPSRTLLGS
ncbi:MAG: formylglycine-generating enzyme family protein [Spirulina sp. SIO3F2]|nr:formylglycine-generating enzyme family protein [Spirulina sp. SIO3F2]